MVPRVFIDGQHGTIGLRIRALLAERRDLEVIEVEPSERKDASAREALLKQADLAILCLPDAAAVQAVALSGDGSTRFIDGSTAHRVAEGWVYGLPEMSEGQRDAIASARLVSNPGCYPTGFILLIRPLVEAGLLAADASLSVHALSGYSGGGRRMIERWEDPASGLAGLEYEAPYGFERQHKHVPQMGAHASLTREPQFVPAVGAFRCGMRVQVPLHAGLFADGVGGEQIFEVLAARYAGEAFVRLVPIAEAMAGDEHSFDPRACNDTNRVELRVMPHDGGHVTLMATLDNLGKGAGGGAVQSMNLMLGLPEQTGLTS